jgi:hypothetical protein
MNGEYVLLMKDLRLSGFSHIIYVFEIFWSYFCDLLNPMILVQENKKKLFGP